MAKSDADRERNRDTGPAGHGSKPQSGAAETGRLRDEIDRGGGDKVAFSDPAAAPLGTDDEAGGSSPTLEQVEHARRQETRASEAQSAKPTPADRQGSSKNQKLGAGTIALIAGACLIILLFFVL